LLGEGVCSPLRQHPAAALEGQGITLSEVFKLPRRVLGRGHNSKPVGRNKVTTYLVEEVKLPRPVEVEIRGKKKRVNRAFLVTIYAGNIELRALGPFIGIGDESFIGMMDGKPGALTAVTFDRSHLREGATLKVDGTELPERLKLEGAKKRGR
jgi:hypothetical protein